MSLQGHSPPQACVAAWVRDVCGIVPAPSECQYFLDTNSCQIQEAARMLHATLEAELWQRGIMSTEQRAVAALIRNETGMFPSVASINFYLENNGSIESAATSLLVEYANQKLREYRESEQTHHRQQQMVRNERDLAEEEHWNKLLATDGSSATVPSVDPLSSTATPSTFASDLHRDPELRATVDALLQDGDAPTPFTAEDADTSPLKSEGEPTHCSATSTVLKSNDGKPMCFFNNHTSTVNPPAAPAAPVYSPTWFKPGSKTRENPITGEVVPLNCEDMSHDLKVLAAQPSLVRPFEYIFSGSQRKGAQDPSGMVHRRAANKHAGETGVLLDTCMTHACTRISAHTHTHTHMCSHSTRTLPACANSLLVGLQKPHS
jgi:hypothetical protein